MNILIVEDDIDVSSVLTESIQHWGYSAENADTCKDALDKVKQKRFDLILLDIFLPDGKGHRLIPQFNQKANNEIEFQIRKEVKKKWQN